MSRVHPLRLFFGLMLFLVACETNPLVTPTPLIAETVPATEASAVAEAADSLLPAGFDLQGHRGARGLKPENSLPAFETALDLMVTTLELDLHFTADDVVVIWHDPAIDKAFCRRDPAATIDAPDPDSLTVESQAFRIRQLTLVQLNTFICDRNADTARFPDQENGPTLLAGNNYRPVSLAQLFDFVNNYSQSPEKSAAQRANAGQVRFNIETKRVRSAPGNIGDGFDGETAGPFELALLELITGYGLADRVTVQSFDHRSLWAIHDAAPDLSLAALTSRSLPDIAALAENGAAIWSPNYNDLTPSLVTTAQAAGLLVIPWTVNDLEAAAALLEMGVDGLITDRPDLFLEPA